MGSVGSWQGSWQDGQGCLDLLGFGKGVWQLIPQFPGLWLHVLSDACCLSSLCSPFHPLAAVRSPQGLWGDVGWERRPGSPCESRECSGDGQDWLRESGCPCRVGGTRGPGPECENVSVSVCLSCLAWAWASLASSGSCLPLQSPPPLPLSWDRLLALSLSLQLEPPLPVPGIWRGGGGRGRQTDLPHSSPPGLASWGNEIGAVELRFPCLPQTLQHTSQSPGGQVLQKGPGLPPPHQAAVPPSFTQHPAGQGPCLDLRHHCQPGERVGD